MKKHTLFTITLLTVMAVFVVSCSKEEEKKYPEESLYGFWEIPLAVECPGLCFKTLTILPGHTAMLDTGQFNYWKLEGDVLTLTKDMERGYNRHELGVMKVIIVDLTDTTMILVGNYIHAVNTTVDMEGDMSGLYKRQIPLPDIPAVE